MSLLNIGRARVGNIIIAVNVIILACVCISSFILMSSLNELKIRGPVYSQIRNAVDLTADILPPPLYLIEAYLTVNQLGDATSPDEIKALKERFAQLEKDFKTREDYWKNIEDQLPDAVKTVLQNKVVPEGHKMLDAVNQHYIPAIDRGAKPEAENAFAEVTKYYKSHRAAVDELVTAATTELSRAEDYSAAAEKKDLTWAYLAIALSALMSILGAVTMISVVAKPLRTASDSLTKLSEGNADVFIGDAVGTGEVPSLWRAVMGLREKVLAEKRLLAEQEAMKARAETEKKKAMKDMADSFQAQVGSIINGVSSAATELQATPEVMRGSADDASKQSGAVAAASEQATANVQTVASATEELSASVREIQERISNSNTMIQQASQQARITNERVQSLTEAAGKIGAVIQLITDIAAQTNLLALNATIEAARAGDAGKGFAVVASEVKNLAGQTAKATDEIAAQIKAIQDETRNSAEAISGITRAIEAITQTSSAIAAAVEEQGSATQEIARNVSEAAQGTQEVSSSILRVSSAAQNTGAAATEVLSAASELSRNGEALKKQVDAFLSKIRAA